MTKVLCFSVWLAALFFRCPAHAVLVTPLDLEALTARAELIVRGTVLSRTCQRDEQGRIFTTIGLQVSEVWKGSARGAELQIVHGGGTLGEQRTIVSGQVEYQPGEEVVGFFVMNQRGEAVTLGLAQGKFHLWRDPATGEIHAANPFHGQGARSTLKAGLAGGSSGEDLLPLVRLKQIVQGAAR